MRMKTAHFSAKVMNAFCFCGFLALVLHSHTALAEEPQSQGKKLFSRVQPDDLEEAENNGNFKDDDYPLSLLQEYRKNPEQDPNLSAPDECKTMSDAFKNGLEQGLSAQRFSERISNNPNFDPGDDKAAKLNPSRSERSACNQWKKAPNESSCCLKGYKQAMTRLSQHIEKIYTTEQYLRSPADQKCMDAYLSGVEYAAGTFCRKQDTSFCPTLKFTAIRYLGCYHLGRAQVQLHCQKNPLRALQTGETKLSGISDILDKEIHRFLQPKIQAPEEASQSEVGAPRDMLESFGIQ